MRFDVWENERKMAERLSNGLLVLKSKTLTGYPSLTLWKPKALKPYVRYSYKDEQRLNESFTAYVENYNRDLAMKEKWKQERAGTPEQIDSVKVGDIFSSSWGYDQTNVDFYQVVAKRGKMVDVREIAQSTVDGSEGMMSDKRLAVKDQFLKDAPVLTKKLQFSCGRPYFKVASYADASLWDGQPKYCSWYA